ncbi:MAG TPA: efflux transporter outer membrane subunit [Burkholderiaceae bacterium]|nr:efflux transporter outer membrane subunit [Burkholderiaceae bacterium]
MTATAHTAIATAINSQTKTLVRCGVATRVATTVLAVASLAACAQFEHATDTRSPMTPQAFGARAEWAAWPDERWWTRFNDPHLTQLIERALADNPDLRVASSRIARAQAAVDVANAGFRPNVDANARSVRQRFSENDIYPPPIGGATVTLNSAALEGRWEFDFFGRQRAALDAALGERAAALADQQAARVLLAARVAQTHIELAHAIELRAVAQATREQRQRIRDLVADRVRAGLDTRVELRQAEGAVPQTTQDIEALDERIAVTRHALAALIGAGPDATNDLAPVLDRVQAQPLPDAIPADLVGRRADVSAARARVEAATAGVAGARAAFYPNINLAAMAGFASVGFGDWFRAGSRTFSVGPAISLPIFEGGRLRAALRAQSAQAEAAVASYDATLIDAVREVADAIDAVRSVDRQQTAQREAQAAAESAYALAEQRYRAGLGTFLSVLSAETAVLTQRRGAVDLRARALTAQIELIRALGGGYQPPAQDLARTASISTSASESR